MLHEPTAKGIKASFDGLTAHGSPSVKAGLKNTCDALDTIKTQLYGTWWKRLWRRLWISIPRRKAFLSSVNYGLRPGEVDALTYRIPNVSKRRALYQEREAYDRTIRDKFSL